ncbi:threonine aldolase family protein [Roseinatronobacter alkalisoli]|uniref:L-threonine aldolase n=1 Tax=Roseinatronobacter alkalisoli TaxID=3028235 RepID=A0ABT5T5G3_9RHOB|nr:low specificity L-threonine aldolase [Roseinatronobacter sp. HJB301]MDD7970360.1 low specificity L-threonine aldolase [Roseinatronobacter sp. HJB301]
MFFASDNTSGVPAPVMDALVRANDGFAAGYGNDTVTLSLRDRIRNLFDAPEAEVFLVTTGSAANALAIASHCPPWGAVFCHELAHINVDECGAPEFYTNGAKLVPLGGAQAKVAPETLADALARAGKGGVHQVQPGLLSLTNLTECGTRYSVTALNALCGLACDHRVPVHLDGARFANALVAEGCSPAEYSWQAGVDTLSLGGTKNGLMGVEAVVIFDPARAWEFQLRRKRGGHLLSKNRFLAAQMIAWLQDDLWLKLARHANAMAARLEDGLRQHPDARIVFERGGNMLFVQLPRAIHTRLQAAGAQYFLWPDHATLDGPQDVPVTGRLVTSWSTTESDVDAFLRALDVA